MIDTHCHLDFPVFDADRHEVLERSRQAGVTQWVVPAVKLADFKRVVSVQRNNVYLAFGLHPWFVAEQALDAVSQLAGWIERYSPVAIGEIGLDFLLPPETFPVQQSVFAHQLLLAKQCNLPVLLHVRKAHDAVLMLLKKIRPEKGGIVHAFNGSLQQAHEYLGLGFKLGFGGVVTRPGASRIRQVAASLPDDALVLETDAPDLPPAGWENMRNEPANLVLVVAALAQLRNTSEKEIMAITTRNSCAILGLKEAGV